MSALPCDVDPLCSMTEGTTYDDYIFIQRQNVCLGKGWTTVLSSVSNVDRALLENGFNLLSVATCHFGG